MSVRFRQSIPQLRKRIEARMMRDTGWIDEVQVRAELKRYADARRKHRETEAALKLGTLGADELAKQLAYNIDVLDKMEGEGVSNCKLAMQRKHIQRLKDQLASLT